MMKRMAGLMCVVLSLWVGAAFAKCPDKCPEGSVCINGKCQETLEKVCKKCKPDEVCINGKCVKAEPCGGCPAGQICIQGVCKPVQKEIK